ncbi:hypothetical protein LCGC14_0583240 [marine sediment metagenome]|uniref:Uncharacterized protein n=1 Tax=marine sediment metagenome TaxID=412755 RepID=A0A0F9RKQ6_9ZZZZ
MTVTEVALSPDSRGGKEGKKGVVTYTRVYQVLTDDTADDSNIVLLSAESETLGLPQRGDDHADETAVVISRDAKEQKLAGGGVKWFVTVTYSSEVSIQQEEDTYGNPDNRLMDLATLDIGTIKYQEPMEEDLAGRALTTDIGEPFNPRLTRDANRQSFKITRNQAFVDGALGIPALFPEYDPQVMRQFENSVNTDSFLWFEIPGQAKIASITSRPASFIYKHPNGTDGNPRHGDRINYRVVTYDVEIIEGKVIRDEAGIPVQGADGKDAIVFWQLRILHAGTHERPLDGKVRRIMQENAPATDPWPLVRTPAGAVVAFDKNDVTHELEYLHFTRYKSMRWGDGAEPLVFDSSTMR